MTAREHLYVGNRCPRTLATGVAHVHHGAVAARSASTYVRITVLWVFGGLFTLIVATSAAISSGFSDNEGMNGASASAAAIVTALLGIGSMIAWTASILRRDRR